MTIAIDQGPTDGQLPGGFTLDLLKQMKVRNDSVTWLLASIPSPSLLRRIRSQRATPQGSFLH